MEEISYCPNCGHQLEQPVVVKKTEEVNWDELYDASKKIVLENNEASTSLLQRKMRIGYLNASKLIDELEEKGVISRQATSPWIVNKPE